jgi:hypothetical protein
LSRAPPPLRRDGGIVKCLTAHEYLEAFLAGGSSEELAQLAATPDFRLALYDALGNQAARLEYGPLLRGLFERELRYRLGDDERDDDAYFENIYFCGLLLYELGSLDDLELLCRAKFCRDMDLGIGFDVHFLVGAGVEITLRYLAQRPEAWAATAHSYLERCKEADDLSWLAEWRRAKRTYFGLNS